MHKKLLTISLLIICNVGFAQKSPVDSLQNVLKKSKDATTTRDATLGIAAHYLARDSTAFGKYIKIAAAQALQKKQYETALELSFLRCKQLNIVGNYKQVIKLADSLLPITKKQGLYDLTARLHNYKGASYSNLSDYANATVAYLDYLKVAKTLKNDPLKIAGAGNNVGMAMLNMRRYDQAIPYLKNSIAVQDTIAATFKAHTYWNLGICYMEKRQYDTALGIFKKGLVEAQDKKDDYAAAGIQLCIASIYVRQDLYEDGVAAYKKAYQMAIKSGMEPFKVIEALNGIIYGNNQLVQPQESMRYVKIADSIIGANKLPDIRNRQFLFHKSAALLLLGKPQEADAVFDRYEASSDSLYNEQNAQIIQQKETEYRTKEKEQQLLTQTLQLQAQRLWIAALVLGLLLISLIGYLVWRQMRLKARNQQQQQDLEKALLIVQNNKKLEQQRWQIGSELHDNIGSQLTYLASAAAIIKKGLATETTAQTNARLSQLSQYSKDAITDLRDTLWVLNRSILIWNDLVERCNYLTQKVNNTTRIKVQVIKTGSNNAVLNPAVAMDVYRIVQEALVNAVKHAKATAVTIHFELDDQPTVSIMDDGDGFNPDIISTSSNGLTSMRNRASKLNAQLEILTNRTGTVVRLHLNCTIENGQIVGL